MAKLFFSYSHRDEEMRDELETHLAMLMRQKVIEPWHDRRIDAGSELDDSIDGHLEDSDIILLLVSPHFLASEYCYDVEVAKAMQMQKDNQATVIPVILHPCDWKSAPFGTLLAVPKDGKPVSKYANINDAFLEITQGIRKVAETLNGTEDPRDSRKSVTDEGPAAVQTPFVRSSNLRVKKDFSDYEKDKFMNDAFEYMARFFENSLAELEARTPGIEYDFKMIDANSFAASLYWKGDQRNNCRIAYRGTGSYPDGITYSAGRMNDNSINESLMVADDGHMLYLSPMLHMIGPPGVADKLTYEGAAEYYWATFIEPLQR